MSFLHVLEKDQGLFKGVFNIEATATVTQWVLTPEYGV